MLQLLLAVVCSSALKLLAVESVVVLETMHVLFAPLLGMLLSEYVNKGFNAIYNVATDGLNRIGYN